MKVTIIGPNLRKQDKGQFHVHAEGCADIRRDPKRYGYVFASPHWTIDADTQYAVVEEIFSDMIFHNDMSPAEDYLSEVHFAPCVKLPLGKPTPKDEPEPETPAVERERMAKARAQIDAGLSDPVADTQAQWREQVREDFRIALGLLIGTFGDTPATRELVQYEYDQAAQE